MTIQRTALSLALPLLLSAALAALSAGCRKAADPFAGMSTEQIVNRLYENAGDLELPALASTPITADNIAYYAGVDELPISEGTASEPLINAIAFSVCVFRLENARDSADVQATLRANVNPNKWICVGVDEQNIVVDGVGDVVILIMADESAALHSSFLKIAGKS